jgi:hypothetical protein
MLPFCSMKIKFLGQKLLAKSYSIPIKIKHYKAHIWVYFRAFIWGIKDPCSHFLSVHVIVSIFLQSTIFSSNWIIIVFYLRPNAKLHGLFGKVKHETMTKIPLCSFINIYKRIKVMTRHHKNVAVIWLLTSKEKEKGWFSL